MNKPSYEQRKIIHLDMDCFYAAVETREDPNLTGLPIAVGGRPDQRGVVATCSYEARAFGIHSAMPMSLAIKKCPQLVIIRPRMSLYQDISKKIRTIFSQYSDVIQPLSLDEAFLDVSNSPHKQGSATLIAQAIRADIFRQEGLTSSAGIAPNKFLAKIASDWNKPNGQFVILPHQISGFMKPLPVKKIFGVGRVTAKKMQRMKIHTCEDLQQLSIQQLQQHFGKFGSRLHQLCRGIDDRPVDNSSVRKSLSIEDTYLKDLPDLQTCLYEAEQLFPLLIQRLQNSQHSKSLAIKNCYVKIRFSDFSTTTKQLSSVQPSLQIYQSLVKQAWLRQQQPVRLIGLGIQFHPVEHGQQTELDIF